MQPKKQQKALPANPRRDLFAAHALAGIMMRTYPPPMEEAVQTIKQWAVALDTAMTDEPVSSEG